MGCCFSVTGVAALTGGWGLLPLVRAMAATEYQYRIRVESSRVELIRSRWFQFRRFGVTRVDKGELG